MATDKELEQQLVEAGNKLVDPPESVDALLQVLDQVENCLSKVEQSPSDSMHDALAPSLKSFVEDQLFKHSNADVRVAVTSCISEITRITAPDAPYDDDQMKDVFKLIVSSFKKLADDSSRSYGKRISILETVAKVRSCVVMLDLECDELIVEMFHHFLDGIRDYHPESVFSSMVTIMSLVLEESEDISVELLYPLLDSVKKENEVPPVTQKLGEKVLGSCSAKKVLPVARRLAEKVLESCAAKVKPYLTNAVKSLGISINNYSGTVAAICEEISGNIGQNDAHASNENKIGDSKHVEASAEDAAQAVDKAATGTPSPKKADSTNNTSSKLFMSNGGGQAGEDDSLGDTYASKEEGDHFPEHSKSFDVSNNQTKSLDPEKVVNTESMPEATSENEEKAVNTESMPEETSENKEKVVNTESMPEATSENEEKVVNTESMPEETSENKEKVVKTESMPEETSENKEKVVNVESMPEETSESEEKVVNTESMPEETTESEEKVVNTESMPEETTENKETKVMKPAEPPKSSDIDTDTVMEEVPNVIAPSEDNPSFTNRNPSEETDVSFENKNETGSRPSLPEVLEGESVTDASPCVSGSLHEEVLSEKAEHTRKEDSLVKDPVSSADDVHQKASDGTANSERRPSKHVGIKPPPGFSVEDMIPSTADASSKENSTTSEREEKPLKKSPMKVDASGKSADRSSLQQSEDKGRRGRGKAVSGKKMKSTTKVEEKVKFTSPKSAAKRSSDEPHLETPLTNGKRKGAPFKEKVSDAEEYGENVVGAKVKVWWPDDRQYYEGIIESFDPVKKKHKVVYLDGDEEVLNLKREKFQFIAGDLKSDEDEAGEHSSADTSSEMPLRKKIKSSDCLTKQGKTGDSSIKRSGGTLASKSKSSASQSAQKSKSLGKTDGNFTGDVKAVNKREDDSGGKLNHHTPKTKSGSKSADVASKSTSKSRNDASVTSKTSKSKEDGTSTPKSFNKSKQETPKTGISKHDNTTSNAKGKPLVSASKSNINATGKMKSGSSKVKETENEEKSSDSDQVNETAKRKSAGSLKGKGSDAKGGRKRRRRA